MAVLSYLGILVLIPLLTEAKKEPFVKFHVQQGLVLLIAWVIGGILFWIPVIGWLLWLVIAIFSIVGIVAAASGKETPLPVVADIAKKFKI